MTTQDHLAHSRVDSTSIKDIHRTVLYRKSYSSVREKKRMVVGGGGVGKEGGLSYHAHN